MYDPIIPNVFYRSLQGVSGQSSLTYFNLFCPQITTAALARLYGVSFVLEHRGAAGPQGSVFVMAVGDEDLYRIPGSGEATLSPLTASGASPPTDAIGTPVPVTHPDPATWKLVTTSSAPQVLRLRLANVPGWGAVIDGQPLALEKFSGIMLQARIPPGQHTVEIHYWPKAFTGGLVLAACSAIGLSVASIVARARRPQRRTPSPAPTGPAPNESLD